MTPMERIQQQLRRLPPEKQSEVLNFISFLQQQQVANKGRSERASLRQHPAFGSWRGRKMDAVEYQSKLRSEWDDRA